jgi:hypothetical protein
MLSLTKGSSLIGLGNLFFHLNDMRDMVIADLRFQAQRPLLGYLGAELVPQVPNLIHLSAYMSARQSAPAAPSAAVRARGERQPHDPT